MTQGCLKKIALLTRVKMLSVYGSPKGECYRWSMNLASDLLDKECPEVYIVNGEVALANNKLAPHSWLRCGHFLIDITADQFNPLTLQKFPSVIVCESIRLRRHKAKNSRRVRDPRTS